MRLQCALVYWQAQSARFGQRANCAIYAEYIDMDQAVRGNCISRSRVFRVSVNQPRRILYPVLVQQVCVSCLQTFSEAAQQD